MASRALSISRHLVAGLVVTPLVFVLACSGDSIGSSGDGGSSRDAGTSSDDDGSASPDDATAPGDAAVADDAGGAPRNAACTPVSQQNGTAVNSDYGRLDGTLVFVVGIGQGHACNGDNSHIHLQVEVSGSVYDVAVDIGATGDEVGLLQQSITVPGGVWEEGWHGADTLTYGALGIHSSSLPLTGPSAVGTQLTQLLESTSKISIFCTGYAQGNGCHDVHYQNGSGGDGAIVLAPTTADSPAVFLRFSTQSF